MKMRDKWRNSAGSSFFVKKLPVFSCVVFGVLVPLVFGWSTLLERTANELDLIESRFGVPVDFGYSETSAGPWKLNSVPGCPKAIDGYPWIYYGSPPRCYLAGQRGPCLYGSKLHVEVGSTYGKCRPKDGPYPQSPDRPDWKYSRFYSYSNSDSAENTENRQASEDNNRAYKGKPWHNAYDRGACEPNQWLVWNSDRTAARCLPLCSGGWSGPMWYNGDNRPGRCVPRWIPGGPFGSSHGDSPPRTHQYDCPQDGKIKYRYSSTLRKCVPVWPEDYLFLGRR